MQISPRIIARVAAVAVPAVAVVAAADAAAADTPVTWEANEGRSTLYLVLVLGGIPLALCIFLALFAMVTHDLGRTRHGRPASVRHEVEWFGGPEAVEDASRPALPGASAEEAGQATPPGGSSAT